jgi:hypothetical protein
MPGTVKRAVRPLTYKNNYGMVLPLREEASAPAHEKSQDGEEQVDNAQKMI